MQPTIDSTISTIILLETKNYHGFAIEATKSINYICAYIGMSVNCLMFSDYSCNNC